jgi:hypothetical protein
VCFAYLDSRVNSHARELQVLDVFRAQTDNVRALEITWRDLNRQINSSIVSKNEGAVASLTRLLAITYCALAEATFSKTVHTPQCLHADDVAQIKNAARTAGVVAGWKKCVTIALRRVEGKANHAPNVRQRIHKLIDTYILDPSLLRNKLAHGQWVVALNRENTKINSELTSQISRLDVVQLYRYKEALSSLSRIVEDMIESPRKAHPRDYWAHVSELENTQLTMATWTLEKKRGALLQKKAQSKQA